MVKYRFANTARAATARAAAKADLVAKAAEAAAEEKRVAAAKATEDAAEAKRRVKRVTGSKSRRFAKAAEIKARQFVLTICAPATSESRKGQSEARREVHKAGEADR